MESRGAKRKRPADVKNTLVSQVYELNNESFKLTEELENANDNFVQVFRSVGERQSEIYAKSVAVDQQYE